VDGYNIQAEEKILAKAPLDHHGIEIPVCRRNESHIHRIGLLRTHRSDDVILENS
jgi:hypothetical protein